MPSSLWEWALVVLVGVVVMRYVIGPLVGWFLIVVLALVSAALGVKEGR